ncbi:MAG: transcriptional regulator [Nitrososphaerota archaeon]|jgi:predicted DNA-binding transcriptional regulator|nr:transcriptional regulator [Nitrososphaerota archaeon]MDG6927895.1 transcriptional regulator [Nitrososphaerota archaeon]MDG6931040.1 transcriptional regulator [Nitrososphaerota archaeon]MDG6932100.1 transcriptional regulator [Nitrososphaerota archaeon]MDG6936655.1 transcriptional regulator [Nitrososphaerota archaeon]
MSNDKALGALIMVVSIIVIFVYAYLDVAYPLILLQVTAFIAVAAILGVLAWIGYTLLTTPAPKPVEDAPQEEPSQEKKEN